MAKKGAREVQPGAASRTARVADGQEYEVRHEAKKGGQSANSVKKAVKKVETAARGWSASSEPKCDADYQFFRHWIFA